MVVMPTQPTEPAPGCSRNQVLRLLAYTATIISCAATAALGYFYLSRNSKDDTKTHLGWGFVSSLFTTAGLLTKSLVECVKVEYDVYQNPRGQETSVPTRPPAALPSPVAVAPTVPSYLAVLPLDTSAHLTPPTTPRGHSPSR